MSYQLDNGTVLDVVALKVKELDKEIAFFKTVLGLELLREENGMAFIGIKETKRSIICLLEEVEGIPSETSHNGLYHFAILLPSRKVLGELYQHLLKIDYPITGLSDQGSSEVIYLKDPEYNGIKLYADKPEKEWDYHTEGTMDGILSRLDSASLLAEAETEFTLMPTEARLGHIHLNVVNLVESQNFYQDILGLQLKSKEFPSLRYLAAGDYHQHVGLNTLNQVKRSDHGDDRLGLDYFAFKVSSEAEMEKLQAHLNELKQDYFYNKGKQILEIEDPNGIHVWFHVKEVKK